MSNPKLAPIDWTTEIDRGGIIKLSGMSITKVGLLTTRDKYDFPKPIRLGPCGILIYSLADVTAWLKTNDLKNIVFARECREPARKHIKAETGRSWDLLAELKIGFKPQKFKGSGTTTTVHIQERNDYQPPHSALTRSSNNAEHRISVSF